MLAVRLNKDVEERLERLARKTGRTKTFYVREAIAEHLEALEAFYLAAERAAAGKPAIPLDEVERRLGLVD